MAEERTRATYLTTVELSMLNDACRRLGWVFKNPPYLVGSALERRDFRDVDVRQPLTEQEWARFFESDSKVWEWFCLASSLALSKLSGLPVDYQAQSPEMWAAEKGERNPLGLDQRPYAGGLRAALTAPSPKAQQ